MFRTDLVYCRMVAREIKTRNFMTRYWARFTRVRLWTFETSWLRSADVFRVTNSLESNSFNIVIKHEYFYKWPLKVRTIDWVGTQQVIPSTTCLRFNLLAFKIGPQPDESSSPSVKLCMDHSIGTSRIKPIRVMPKVGIKALYLWVVKRGFSIKLLAASADKNSILILLRPILLTPLLI